MATLVTGGTRFIGSNFIVRRLGQKLEQIGRVARGENRNWIETDYGLRAGSR